MAQKTVTVQLDPETLEFSVNNEGFQGKGCTVITQEFAKGNKVLKDVHKPEYKLANQNTVCQ